LMVGGGVHAPAGNEESLTAETALGEHVPDHARPNLRWSLRISTVFLLLWLVPVAALVAALGPDDVFARIGLFFSQMAVVTFGGAYAVLAYVAQQAVETYRWLQPGEMLDGLGMAETTPGPLIMVTQFVGFMGAYRSPGGLDPLLAGTLGGLLTTWVTFVPCFLWIFLGAPFVERLRGNAALAASLSVITAAIVGVVLNLAIWFALHTLFLEVRHVEAGPLSFDAPVLTAPNLPALLLAAAALFAMFRLKLGPLTVLAGCAAAGIALRLAGLA
jgi:chromate transporter